MIKNIKIENEVFEYHDVQCQLAFEKNATLFITFDIQKNPHYKKHFLNIYDNEIKFHILSSNFISKINMIKSIDLTSKLLTLIIKSESVDVIPADQRRDDIIEELLNTTFENKDSINN